MDYYGVPADDSPSFDLSRYFFPSAEYIHNALDTTSGKYPSCLMSASADLSLVSSLIDHMLYAHRDVFLLLPLQVEFSSTVLLA